VQERLIYQISAVNLYQKFISRYFTVTELEERRSKDETGDTNEGQKPSPSQVCKGYYFLSFTENKSTVWRLIVNLS